MRHGARLGAGASPTRSRGARHGCRTRSERRGREHGQGDVLARPLHLGDAAVGRIDVGEERVRRFAAAPAACTPTSDTARHRRRRCDARGRGRSAPAGSRRSLRRCSAYTSMRGQAPRTSPQVSLPSASLSRSRATSRSRRAMSQRTSRWPGAAVELQVGVACLVGLCHADSGEQRSRDETTR